MNYCPWFCFYIYTFLCLLLITFANSFDPDQAWSWSKLFDSTDGIPERNFWKKKCKITKYVKS